MRRSMVRRACPSSAMSTESRSEEEAPPAPAQIRVRAATRRDMPDVYDMIQELAEFEGMPRGPQLSVDELVADGFDASPAWFFVLVAESGAGGGVVGHALCNRAYSSWTRRAYYVEDLYVRPAWRRQGVGLRLLHELCQMAVREGVHRVDWHVLESNAAALRFYSRLGARDLRVSEGRAAMRLDRPHIEQLARRCPAPPAAPAIPATPAPSAS